MNVCLFVCMYVWNLYKFTFLNRSELNFAHFSFLVWKIPRVCMDAKFLTSSTFCVLFLWGPLQNHGHKMAAGATVFRDNHISVIPDGVRVTSPTLRCGRRRCLPLQPCIRDSSGSSPNVAKWRRSRWQSHPPQRLLRRVFASRHGNYVQPGDGANRQSVISLTIAPVSVTHRKSCPCRRQLRFPTPCVRNA